MLEIYALGHSNYSFEKFVEYLKKYNINCVVDIRSVPYSRYNSQYNKEEFSENLRQLGYTYVHMPEEFGVKRSDKGSYNDEGYADFDRVVKEESFRRGVERLRKGIEKGYRIVLVAAMQEAIRCPRGILVGRELYREGFDVKYITHEGGIVSQADLEEQMLNKYFEGRDQLTIDHLLGTGADREEMIEECYRKANREIGLRVEKIDPRCRDV